VLDNDTDVENDTLTVLLDATPSNGTLTLNTDGSFSYTPHVNFYGSDTFTYHANDGLVDSNIATVTITVNAANDKPVALNDSYSTGEDTKLTVASPGVLDNDTDVENDTLTVLLDATPSNGTLTLNTDGSFSYTPHVNFYGSDTFTYHANDGLVDSNIATVTITVNAINDPPVANDMNETALEETLDYWQPDVSDVDGDELTCSVVGEISEGAILYIDPYCSTSNYTPPPNFYGTDSFTYEVCDGSPLCDTGTVTYTVTSVSMHVGDLDAIPETAPRNRWNAMVNITVHDAMNLPVANAEVSGSWSAGATGGGTCITDTDGSCEVKKNNIKSNVSSVTFTVEGSTHPSLTYKPSANDDPDGDSNGTWITIYKDSVPSNQPPSASFSYGCTSLSCDFDASESTDADGSIVSYAWDYGDDNGGINVTSNHSYISAGLYTVVLTVTDDGGASSTDTQLVNVGGVVQLMHVGDIDGSTSDANRGRWNATATITVHSENHTVLEGATVSATWSTGKVGNCTTNASGECSLTLSNIKSTVVKVIFTVTNLTAPGWEYDSSSNHDPDNDSNDTSIDIDYPPS
jgi:VCBS repeat-containing protein